MNDRKFMIWFLLLTRASELYLVQFLYVYVCIFDTEDMTTGTGTYNSVLGTLVRDSPNTFSGQVPDNWYQVTASYGNCAVSNILACFIVYKIFYLSQMTATSW